MLSDFGSKTLKTSADTPHGYQSPEYSYSKYLPLSDVYSFDVVNFTLLNNYVIT